MSTGGGGSPSSSRVHDHPSDVDCRGVRSPSSSGGKDPCSPSESALRIGGKAASCFGEPPDANLPGDDLERGPAERKSWELWRRRWRERLVGRGDGRPFGPAKRLARARAGLRDGSHAGRGAPGAGRPRRGSAGSKTRPGPRGPYSLRHGSGGGPRGAAPGTGPDSGQPSIFSHNRGHRLFSSCRLSSSYLSDSAEDLPMGSYLPPGRLSSVVG